MPRCRVDCASVSKSGSVVRRFSTRLTKNWSLSCHIRNRAFANGAVRARKKIMSGSFEKLAPPIDREDKYFSAYADIGVHHLMIEDQVRTQTYKLAILRNYENIYGKVVVDIGAGTGILSMFCVMAGAKKVYAIEASDMAEQARAVVQSNSMQDRITVIHGKVEDVTLPEKADVIVSEWMGYMLLFESMLPTVICARDRWLKPGGVMLPETAVLYIAPFSDGEFYEDRVSFWDDVKQLYGLDMSVLKPYTQESLARYIHVRSFCGENIMARASEIARLNLSSVDCAELARIAKSFSFDCYGDETIHGFVCWFKVFFPKDTCLSTSPFDSPTHWEQAAIVVREPFAVKQGDKIDGDIVITPNERNSRYLDATLTFCVNNGPVTTVTCELGENS